MKNTPKKVNCDRHSNRNRKVNKRQIFGARSRDRPRYFLALTRVHAGAKVNKMLTAPKRSPLWRLISPANTGLHPPNNDGLTEFFLGRGLFQLSCVILHTYNVFKFKKKLQRDFGKRGFF